MQVLDERLYKLKENCDANTQFSDLSALATRLINDLRPYDIIEKIELEPNDLLNGSIGLHIKTMPRTVVLKVWFNSNMFYLSFFKKTSDNFDEQLKQTFNESGIMPAKTLQEVEERILDFLANEVYNRNTKSELT